MLRSGLMILTLMVFMIAVGLGVITSNEQFNRMVLPDQPIKLYEYTQQKNGNLQIEIIGEKIAFNPQVALGTTAPYWQIAKQSFGKQLNTAQEVIFAQWNTLRQSEQVRAVNQWVEEKI